MPTAGPLSSDDRGRYARHLTLPGMGEAGQVALRDARVLVVGAGGLGAPVLAYLAAAGVGMLGIVDDDVVELSNLQRQVIHDEARVGRSKTSSAAQFVTGLNSTVEVIEHDVRLDTVTALEILADYDVVVDGTDNFTTRYVVNDACVALRLPLVWASISQFSGQLGVVKPKEGPCYRCLFPRPLRDDEVPNCAVGGVLGVLPGVMGTLEASEVVKVLTGLGEVAAHGVTVYDALTTTFERIPLTRDPNCGVCGDGKTTLFAGLDERPESGGATPAPVRELRPDELASLGELLVVDVREPDEVDVVATPTAWGQVALAPLSQWGPSTRDEVIALAEGRTVLTVCAAGVRSTRAARLLLEGRDVNVVSLAGGLGGLSDG